MQRVRAACPGPGTGSGTEHVEVQIIGTPNSTARHVITACTRRRHGLLAGDTSHTNMEFRRLRSSVRLMAAGIQVEPRANSSGMIIDGNAFHGVGYNASGSSSIFRRGSIANACGGTTSNVVVSSNLMWDLGGGGVLVFVSPNSAASFRVTRRTIYITLALRRSPQ